MLRGVSDDGHTSSSLVHFRADSRNVDQVRMTSGGGDYTVYVYQAEWEYRFHGSDQSRPAVSSVLKRRK